MPETKPELARIIVKRYAAGKAFACADGDPEFAEQAERALGRSLVMEVRIDDERFISLMREQGVPDAATVRYLASLRAIDEAWFQDGYPT